MTKINRKSIFTLILLIPAILLWNSCSIFRKSATEINIQQIDAFPDMEFILHQNEQAVFKKEELTIRILKFYNSPCPKGANCIWSGVGVELECIHKKDTARGIDLSAAFGYKIKILETDHEKFARLILNSGN